MRKRKLLFLIPIGIAAIAIFATVGGLIVRELWNWLLPGLFGWRMITFWQALGLLVLCRILFGGWGGHGRGRDHARQRIHERMREKWEKMTPEEREKYRNSWRGRCSGFMESEGPQGPQSAPQV